MVKRPIKGERVVFVETTIDAFFEREVSE